MIVNGLVEKKNNVIIILNILFDPSLWEIMTLTSSVLKYGVPSSTYTGLSDCHKLVLTVLKTTFSKNKPKERSVW